MKHSIFPLLLSFALLFTACSKDEDNNPTPGGGSGTPGEIGDPVFTCTIDGDSFEAHPLLIAGTSSDNGGLFTRTAAGIAIENGDTTAVTITMTSFNADSFHAGALFDAANTAFGDWCFGSVSLDNGTSNEFTALSTEGDLSATVNITDYDETAETFSGTFSFEAEDPSAAVSKSITSGVFTDVSFD